MLRIRLVGGVTAEADGHAIPPPASRRAWALLAWLALHPGLHSRADVAAKLWPDVLDTSARQSMRSALWSLRQAVEAVEGARVDAVLITTRDRVGLGDDVDVDARAFDECLRAGRLADAVAVGDGPLLAGIDDEWALVARDAHRERLVAALGELARGTADHVAAIGWARRAAAIDPLSEEAARALMEQLAAAGDRSSALAAYQRFAERLQRELRVPPSEPTWKLAEHIRTGATRPAGQGSGRPIKARAQTMPMIGRRAQLDMLREAWAGATNGHGGLAVVHGEAGIGKTRLVTELGQHVRRGGGGCATGAPPDLAGEAFTPWVEVCANLVGQVSELPEAPWVDALAALVPTLVPSAIRSTVPPDLEQARLAESVVALLALCAQSGPLLVVIEDLHAADEASLGVLAHVARRMSDHRVLIVGTRRERPVRDRLAALEQSHRQRGTLRAEVALGPLDSAAVARLARSVGDLSDADVDSVVDVADGNALLAVEVARALVAGDPVPLGLRGATRAATARLPRDAKALVVALAVAGRDLDAREAAVRADVDIDDALAPAEDEGLLVATGDRVGFRHALLREAVYADMSGTERSKAHERAAGLLQAGGSHARAAEAASHLRAVGRLSDAGHLLVQSAARARALGALADATALLREATAALPDDPAPALELADVLAWRGLTADAQAAFAKALPLIEASGDAMAVAEAHLRYAEWHYGPICLPSASVPACEQALAVLDGAGLAAVELRGQILAVYAWSMAVVGDPEAMARALAMLTGLTGEHPTDPLLAAGLERIQSWVLLRQGRFAEAVAPAVRSAERYVLLGRLDLLYTALINAAFGLVAGGDFPAALALLDQSTAAVAGHGVLALEAHVLVYRAWVLARLDRMTEAREAVTQARRVADRLDAPAVQATVDAERGRLSLRAGDYSTAARFLGAALSIPDAAIGRPLARLQRAESLAREGRLDAAEAELAEVVFEPVREGDWPETLVLRMATVEGLVAAARGEIDLARRRLGESVAGWRRLASTDPATLLPTVMADLGRPIIGLVLPAEELAVVEADLAALL